MLSDIGLYSDPTTTFEIKVSKEMKKSTTTTKITETVIESRKSKESKWKTTKQIF